MEKSLPHSELILNQDGSIYHLALLPGDIATTIILVGDQNRVALVSHHFDRIDLQKQKREFVTHTGWIGEKRITVISTGIGTDNIDIVINELDALINIDFKTRQLKTDLQSFDLIRVGTSGSIHPDIHIHDIVVSQYAVGTDSMGLFYNQHESHHELLPSWSYLTKAYPFDLTAFPMSYKEGVTLTCPGFYGAQGRILRLTDGYTLPIESLQNILIHGYPITNLEMETAGIYLLAEKLNHRAISFNAVLAERLKGEFSSSPSIIIHQLIESVLRWIIK